MPQTKHSFQLDNLMGLGFKCVGCDAIIKLPLTETPPHICGVLSARPTENAVALGLANDLAKTFNNAVNNLKKNAAGYNFVVSLEIMESTDLNC